MFLSFYRCELYGTKYYVYKIGNMSRVTPGDGCVTRVTRCLYYLGVCHHKLLLIKKTYYFVTRYIHGSRDASHRSVKSLDIRGVGHKKWNLLVTHLLWVKINVKNGIIVPNIISPNLGYVIYYGLK